MPAVGFVPAANSRRYRCGGRLTGPAAPSAHAHPGGQGKVNAKLQDLTLWCSPEVGRYIENDPIGLNGGLNTYAYVGGNPLKLSDPPGLDNSGMGPYGPSCGPSWIRINVYLVVPKCPGANCPRIIQGTGICDESKEAADDWARQMAQQFLPLGETGADLRPICILAFRPGAGHHRCVDTDCGPGVIDQIVVAGTLYVCPGGWHDRFLPGLTMCRSRDGLA
jgi:hypothetical protein